MEYVSHEAEKAPALVLANLGYDVWLGNNRGNRFSLAHLYRDPNEKSFWDFY
jgi:lysosomal acid lipase/cholesteryl ester hydrolase